MSRGYSFFFVLLCFNLILFSGGFFVGFLFFGRDLLYGGKIEVNILEDNFGEIVEHIKRDLLTIIYRERALEAMGLCEPLPWCRNMF